MRKSLCLLALFAFPCTVHPTMAATFADISATIGNSAVAAMGDVNNDGWVDLLGCGGILLNSGEIVDGAPTFRCLREGLDFSNETLSHSVLVDIDGDGDQDLMAAERYGDARLYRNDSCREELRFVDITVEAGLGGNIGYEQTHIALADIDGDGDLDAYLTEGWPAGKGGVLYRNDSNEGGISFTDITAASGLKAPMMCRSILFRDFDGDGDSDLYLGSYGNINSNKLYLNRGDINGDSIPDFLDATAKSGLNYYGYDNGATAGDIDNDGDLDIVQAVAAGAVYGWIKIFRNEGDKNGDGIVDFTDTTTTSGIARAAHHGVGLGDIDNDGDLDLADANFHFSPLEFYLNRGNGTFVNGTTSTGIGYLTYGVRTLFADLDNDGDLDLWMNRLFLNTTDNDNYLKVLLLGKGANRDAIGAKLRVWPAGVEHTAGNLAAYREVSAGTSFFSSDDPILELGLAKGEYDLEATFVDGTIRALNNVPTGQTVKIPAGGNVLITPPPCGEVAVMIDIKPGSEVNPINIDAHGVIPVAVMTGIEFDATAVNPLTVTFGPAEVPPVHFALEDVDSDGDIDLILHFLTQETGIAMGDTEAVLTGETYVGQRIAGADIVRIQENRGGKR